ncbi:MAG: TIGR04282 family arsenosugar biosynthesis glycosyltransferase [Sinobacteraceae bacterium]|nr:TIGR04282 family arsenosugar biosynthesis glycosyltransferase [Nevskiaceae bacterium]
MAKAPRPGVTKTRLCPPLRPDQAAQLASAFLLDTLATANMAGVRSRLVCRNISEQQALHQLVGPGMHVSVQSGEGLGDALEGAFRDGLADGAKAVAVLGADSPTLPVLVVREAFVALACGFDVVLGPAEDGGYYLLAGRAVYPWLFREMSWSTDGVASETLRRCRTLGLRTHVLPTWYDVDNATSLDILRTDLRRMPTGTAAHTRAVLHALGNSILPLGSAA